MLQWNFNFLSLINSRSDTLYKTLIINCLKIFVIQIHTDIIRIFLKAFQTFRNWFTFWTFLAFLTFDGSTLSLTTSWFRLGYLLFVAHFIVLGIYIIIILLLKIALFILVSFIGFLSLKLILWYILFTDVFFNFAAIHFFHPNIQFSC